MQNSSLKTSLLLAALLGCGCLTGCAGSSDRDTVDRRYGKQWLWDENALKSIDQHIKTADDKVDAGDLAGAAEELAAAAELDPADVRVLWRIALVAEAHRKPVVGMRALRILVAVKPECDKDPDVLAMAKHFGEMKQ